MTKPILNISIGKIYPASYILNEIKNFPSRVQIGHAIMKVNDENRHVYYINESKLKNLNETELKVLSIINPCEQNFAYKLIMSPETQKNLKKIKEDEELTYVFNINDLTQAGYRFKGTKCAINCMNCVFKKNELPFISSDYSEGKIDRKHFVIISYRNPDTLGIVNKTEE